MEIIASTLNYIRKNFDKQLSLDTLAAQAHYSPYHFHRLFKRHVGEAPLQYLSRIRLEKAMKELLFYPHKSIFAIALDCGFSSQSVFARAFKTKYNITAEQYRKQALNTIQTRYGDSLPDVQQYPVTVARQEHIHLIYETVILENEASIMASFKRLHTWASVRSLLPALPEYYGVFLDSPFSTPLQKCRYMAGVRIQQPVSERDCETIGGTIITQIPVMGNYEVLTDYAIYVKHRWLRDSGYEIIQGIPGYEKFTEIDFNLPYAQHYRTICVGVQIK